MEWKIPLYNCYWCKCAYCLNYPVCNIKQCHLCEERDRIGRIPYIRKECTMFIEKEHGERIADCRNCPYVEFYNKVRKACPFD
jgi:hypothetical protein